VICEPNRHAILSQTTQALMRNHPFDLLIIEQIMDSGTGIDVLNNYRTRHYNETPIIIVFEQEPDMLQNLSVNHLRFAACLTAPFDIKILTVAIKCITHHNA